MAAQLDLVTIVMPLYNCAEYLSATVQSVIAQTNGHWRLNMVVDPKSADDSARMAEAWAAQDSRIQVLYAQAKGVAAARNFGIQNAVGPYLAFLDADDVWLPCKLSEQLRAMHGAAAGFSCTRFRRVDRPGLKCGRLIGLPTRIRYRRLLQQNCILTSTVMIDQRVHPVIQFQDVGCEDFDLWLRLLRGGRECLGIQQDLVRYRIVPGSRGSSKWRSLRETWQIYRQSVGLGRFLASSIMMPFLARNLLKYSRF